MLRGHRKKKCTCNKTKQTVICITLIMFDTHRHPVPQRQARQSLSGLELVFDASLANRRQRGPHQAAVGPGAAPAQQAVAVVVGRRRRWSRGHWSSRGHAAVALTGPDGAGTRLPAATMLWLTLRPTSSLVSPPAKVFNFTNAEARCFPRSCLASRHLSGPYLREGDDASQLNILKKRRVADLLANFIPEDEAALMSNGRYTCLVCSYRPVFDTVDMLTVHRNGNKHLEGLKSFYGRKTRLKNEIAKRQHEKYVQLEDRSQEPSSSAPLLEQTRRLTHHALLKTVPYNSCHRNTSTKSEKGPGSVAAGLRDDASSKTSSDRENTCWKSEAPSTAVMGGSKTGVASGLKTRTWSSIQMRRSLRRSPALPRATARTKNCGKTRWDMMKQPQLNVQRRDQPTFRHTVFIC
uniref:Sodium channel modifier 1 n=1 Tax=Scophthalmus maximus TaxID=52904 RepID=A0A8D3CU13_SCOMX